MNTDTIDSVRIAVDYGKSLQEMIAAANYDWVNGDITPSRFPFTRKEVVQLEAKAFHFGKFISSEGALLGITAESPQNPWQPAPIEALIAYGVKNPPERFTSLIALGSLAQIDSRRLVPCVDRTSSGPYLDLTWLSPNCSEVCHFLAVRKLP
jgi:hypothetical protein